MSDSRQPTERPKVGSLEWARQLASDSVRAGEAETTGKPTERRVGERRKRHWSAYMRAEGYKEYGPDVQALPDRRKSDRRAVSTGEGAREWLRVECIDGNWEVFVASDHPLPKVRLYVSDSQRNAEQVRDVLEKHFTQHRDAYAAHRTLSPQPPAPVVEGVVDSDNSRSISSMGENLAYNGPVWSTAYEFALSRLTPDPNAPNEDTYVLHFPRAVEEVTGRKFWLEHLPELLDAYSAELERGKREALQLENDCLDAAKKAGLKLVRQPLAEYADVPLGESYEFENERAQSAERQLAETRRVLELIKSRTEGEIQTIAAAALEKEAEK